MTIDPATLNRRLTIERYTLVSGSWNDEFVWSDVRTTWAAMKYESADEEFAADQAYARRVVTFTTRFMSDITAVDRVTCMGVTYDIKGLREIGNRDGLEIKAEATDPGGA